MGSGFCGGVYAAAVGFGGGDLMTAPQIMKKFSGTGNMSQVYNPGNVEDHFALTQLQYVWSNTASTNFIIEASAIVNGTWRVLATVPVSATTSMIHTPAVPGLLLPPKHQYRFIFDVAAGDWELWAWGTVLKDV